MAKKLTKSDGTDETDATHASHLSPESHAGLGLGDDGPPASDLRPPTSEPRGQQGDELRPYCARHNVLMTSYATRGPNTHYRCPVDGCEERAKRVRPALKVPAEPMLCRQRHCPGSTPSP